MKKILFATTALVASAGLASAEVSISGSAEMGLFSVQGTTDASNADLQFHNDVDINFSLSGESDGGLSFGGSVDLDEALFLGITTFENEYSLFISGDFGTVTMGDTDGALVWEMQES